MERVDPERNYTDLPWNGELSWEYGKSSCSFNFTKLKKKANFTAICGPPKFRGMSIQ